MLLQQTQLCQTSGLEVGDGGVAGEGEGGTREGGQAWGAEDLCCGRWVSRRIDREKE